MLTKEQIQKKAPAVYSSNPSERVSDKYKFISTGSIIDILDKHKWYVSDAKQQPTTGKYKERISFKRHVVRFRNNSFTFDKESIPEIVIVNSHDRSSTLRFYIGMFRLVCSNGLTIMESKLEEAIFRHIGVDNKYIVGVLEKSITQAKTTFSQIGNMKKIILSQEEKIEIARKSAIIKWQNDKHVNLDELLNPRRLEDKKDDLWTVYNVIQENIIKGGLIINSNDKRIRHTKEVRSIYEDIRVNTALWKLVESKREIK